MTEELITEATESEPDRIERVEPPKCSNPNCPLTRAHSGPCAPKDWPSDAEVEAMRCALNAADIDYSAREQRANAGGGEMEPGDWFTFLARAALRAAAAVRGTGGEQ